MKFKTILLSSVSAVIAFTCMPGQALSQILINCTRNLYFGEQIRCSDSVGRYIIEPDNSTTLEIGCLTTLTPPEAAQCQISSGVVQPVNDVLVTFSGVQENLAGPGAGLSVRRFRMQEEGQPGEVTQLTFTPFEIINTVTVNFAGRLHFDHDQTLGSYTGNIQITAEEVP